LLGQNNGGLIHIPIWRLTAMAGKTVTRSYQLG